MPASVLEVRGLAKKFGALAALDGVDLDLAEGEVLGLLGPNGAGKSTLVRAIMGRVQPDAGTISLFGKPAPPRDTSARSRVGFVPQELALYPLLTPRENLAAFGRFLGLDGEPLDRAVTAGLEWAALADRAGTITKNLSGGMKRRLNMAIGVLAEPALLLLDEPTVGVDPQSRERIYEMIESLKARRTTIVYTTHYMEEAERLCDRIAIIDHGRIVAAGTRDELVERCFGGGRELTVECDRPLPQGMAERLGGTTAAGSARLVLPSHKPAEEIPRVLRELEAEGLAVADLRLEQPRLERVFLHLTGRELRE